MGVYFTAPEQSNLMCTAAAGRNGTDFTNWQTSVIRSGEWVTYQVLG